MHTSGSVHAGVRALVDAWEIDDRDVIVHALPLFHVHGLCVALLTALTAGATVRLLPRFSVEGVLAAFAGGEEDGPGTDATLPRRGTVFMAVPTMIRRLLDHFERQPDAGRRCGSARLFCCGSAALPAADLEAFERATGHRIVERYGMSETLITLSNPLRGERRAGTVGMPLPGVETRVVDDELWVSAPSVMRGYFGDPDQTRRVFVVESEGAERRWLRTGDMARVSGDGYVSIVGRLSTDVVKVGGHKVSTREIEEQLATHPLVAEVAVVGVPDAEWGERLVACVVPRLPQTALTLEALQAHLQVAKHKLPRQLLLLEALPRNAMGKVTKAALVAAATRHGVE
jgi:acyl-CoA synthetase (AMP-forming)/AMP-acid ligase II